VTGVAPEVKKIAAIAERIKPDKVHLNTVSRPPSEEYAHPVTPNELERYGPLFTCTVEVVGGSGSIASHTLPPREITDEDILALIRRRPCTVQGVSAGLGIHAHEAAKRLQMLHRKGLVIPVRERGAVYFGTVQVK
jgi:wyosine [tRNA(Phe)-imidazoG37] synthetase (radical SAM superfamily)